MTRSSSNFDWERSCPGIDTNSLLLFCLSQRSRMSEDTVGISTQTYPISSFFQTYQWCRRYRISLQFSKDFICSTAKLSPNVWLWSEGRVPWRDFTTLRRPQRCFETEKKCSRIFLCAAGFRRFGYSTADFSRGMMNMRRGTCHRDLTSLWGILHWNSFIS